MPDDTTNDYTTPDTPDNEQAASRALEAERSDETMYHPAADQEKLAEDNDPPATPAPDDPADTKLPADHPEFDYRGDQEDKERYDEGPIGATDATAHEEQER